mmetsp:Transcript_133777/g.346325  ORF Transcript_133777/g.346325 Transcript_133777/m.346325 type:complete len:231 (-) Transcript_133777:7-699(-)
MRRLGSDSALAKPLKSLRIAHLLHDAAHEDLYRPGLLPSRSNSILATCHVARQAQRMPQLILRGRHGNVDFVAQNGNGHIVQRGLLQQHVQLLAGLHKACPVCGIHNEDEAIHSCVVILPDPACGLVPSQVEGPEANVPDHELLILWIQCRLAHGHTALLQHLQQRGLPRIVKAQEADLGVPREEPEEVEEATEPAGHAAEHRRRPLGTYVYGLVVNLGRHNAPPVGAKP